MILTYPKAKRATLKSAYIYNSPGFSFKCEIGAQAECPDKIAYMILNKDGDIIKQVKEPEKKAVIKRKKKVKIEEAQQEKPAETVERKQVMNYEVT